MSIARTVVRDFPASRFRLNKCPSSVALACVSFGFGVDGSDSLAPLTSLVSRHTTAFYGTTESFIILFSNIHTVF